jgi:hypothetical protein
MTGKASDEEAAWRDLVAQFGNPAVYEDASNPWPTREDLPVPAADPGDFRSPAADLAGSPGVTADPENSSGSAAGPEDPPGRTAGPADPSAHDAGPADPSAHDADPTDRPGHDADPTDRPGHDADLPAAETPAGVSPVPSADEVPGADELPGADQVPGAGPVPGVIPAPAQFRIVRPALPSPLPDTDDDERYVPPVPPPLPRLDPASKLAWAALFGGPGYLLVSVIAGWQISSLAGFVAVAAFVGGFAALIMRMGDRPPDDSGPDDGAVV